MIRSLPATMRRCAPALAAAVLAAPFAASASPVSAPAHVPADVRAVISISDTNTMWGAIEQAPFFRPLAGILQMPMVAEEEGFQEMVSTLREAGDELGFSLMPGDLLGGSVQGIDLYLAGEASGLLIVRFDDPAKASATVDYIARRVAEEFGQEPDSVTISEIPAKAFGAAHMAAFGDLMLFGTDMAVVESALDSDGISNLMAIDGLSAALDTIHAGHGQMFGYGSGAAFKTMMQMGPPEMAAAAESIPDGQFAFSMSYAPTAITMVSKQWGSEVSPEMARLVSTPAADAAVLASFAPTRSLMTVSTNLADLPMLWETLMEAAANDPATGMYGFLAQGYAMNVGAMMGMDFESEILPAFGPHAVFSLNSLAFTPMPKVDLVKAVQIADADRAARVIEQVESMIASMAPGATPEVEEHQGAQLRTIPMPDVAFLDGVTHTVTPDGYWVVGLSKASVRQALDRAAGGAGSIGSDPRIADALEAMDGSAHVLSTLNLQMLGGTLQMASGMALGMMGAGPDEVRLAQAAIDAITAMGVVVSANQYGPDGGVGVLAIMMD